MGSGGGVEVKEKQDEMSGWSWEGGGNITKKRLISSFSKYSLYLERKISVK